MASSTAALQPVNFGASINLISGIQGVSPGGQASINMPVNNRIHRENFQCTGVGYGLGGTTPTAVPTTVDAGATFTVVTLNGIISAIVPVGTVSTHGAGAFALTITGGAYVGLDGVTRNIGSGATATYTVNGANLVTGTTITNPGTVSALPAELFITSVKHLVNGIVMRDISAADVIRIALENSIAVPVGEFPVYFTEPWRKIVDHDQATAWDLIGQSTYQILIGISTGVASPSLNGTFEFDYTRNSRRGADGKPVLFLRPIKQHTFTFNVPAGVYNVTSLPVDQPIQRMFLRETGANSITYVELYQDGNKILEGSYEQVTQMLAQYGFTTTIFDFPIVFDPDQRLGKALQVNNLILRVYSAAPTALNVVMEIQNNNYS